MKLIRFLTKTTWIRVILYMMSLLFAVQYLCTFFTSISYYWGLPAYKMSVRSKNDEGIYINSNNHCNLDRLDYEKSLI